MSSDVTVQNNLQSTTYDAIIDGDIVGSIIYELKGNRVVISHTIVEPEHRGQGIATTLAKAALEDIRERGQTITNYCSFITTYIKRHPEYGDLIDTAHPGFALRP